jgi:hypothetical protein
MEAFRVSRDLLSGSGVTPGKPGYLVAIRSISTRVFFTITPVVPIVVRGGGTLK